MVFKLWIFNIYLNLDLHSETVLAEVSLRVSQHLVNHNLWIVLPVSGPPEHVTINPDLQFNRQ